MSKMKNGGLDQYGGEPFKQQQFGTAIIEGVKGLLTDSSQRVKGHYNCLLYLSMSQAVS